MPETNPYRQYFTQTRLIRLRQLQQRYPSWCLPWPRSVPFVRGTLAPHTLLNQALRDLRQDAKAWDSAPELGDMVEPNRYGSSVPPSVEVYTLDWDSDGEIKVHYLTATIQQATLRAVAYVTTGGAAGGLRSPMDTLLENIEQVLRRNQREHKISGPGLLRLMDRALLAASDAARPGELNTANERSDSADDARDALVAYWREVGEAARIIPSRQGGLGDLIPVDWLYRFSEEAKALAKEVRQYRPSDTERDLVRELLLAGEFPAGSVAIRMTAKERLKEGKSPRDAYKGFDQEVDLNQWCCRLAFPMLTRDELSRLVEEKHPWLWLPAERIGITESRLTKRRNKFTRAR